MGAENKVGVDVHLNFLERNLSQNEMKSILVYVDVLKSFDGVF